MATAIRNDCGCASSWPAAPMAMGHITAAVAALFMKSGSVIVTTRIIVSASTAWPCASVSISPVAMTRARPVDSIAPATGIMAPSSTTTGQSTAR